MTCAPRLSRVILATAAGLALAIAAAPAAAAGYLKLGDIKGESSDSKHKDWIDVESWSWGESRPAGAASGMRMKGSKIGENAPASGDADRPLVTGRIPNTGVEREMKESGEKGGTEDINIGVGELQELTVDKSMDKSSPKLLEYAAKGKVFKAPAPRGSLTTLVPAGTCRVGARYPKASLETGTMRFKMENIMVTSCTTGGSGGSGGMVPTEQISLNYEKVTTTRIERLGD